MRKINVTIIGAADEDETGCAAIVGSCPEFNLVGRLPGLYAPGCWSAIARSDVVLLDEAVIDHDGKEAVRMISDCYPYVRVLLVLDRKDDRRAMEAFTMGITGIMMRPSAVSMLRKAIPVLCSGEAWVSRDLVHAIRTEGERGAVTESEWYSDRLLLSREKLN